MTVAEETTGGALLASLMGAETTVVDYILMTLVRRGMIDVADVRKMLDFAEESVKNAGDDKISLLNATTLRDRWQDIFDAAKNFSQ